MSVLDKVKLKILWPGHSIQQSGRGMLCSLGTEQRRMKEAG